MSISTVSTSALRTGEYTLDPSHSRLGFVARHAMVTKVRGQFGQFSGSAHVDIENPSASSVTVSIEVASVDTGSEARDAHLRTGDFFDAPAYPNITFVSTAVAAAEGVWAITGDLTIKDVTKSVTIDFDFTGAARDPFGNERVGFEGSLKVKRSEFGVTWNAPLEAGGVLVSDDVTLEFDISAISA